MDRKQNAEIYKQRRSFEKYCISSCKIAMHFRVHQTKSHSCASYEGMYGNRAIDPGIISLTK